jgi:predicted esterase
MRATKYRRSLIHQWYDGSGDWEPEARGNMRESVEHIQALIRDEVRLLGGDASRVVLMGFSQGCAMALTSLLLWEGDALGAVVGMSGFIPLNAHMTDLLEGQDQGDEGSDDGFVFGSDSSSEHGSVPDDSANGVKSPLQQAIRDLRDEAELSTTSTCMSPLSFLQTPVFIGHGTEDPKVKYVHGRLAARLLEKMGIRTEFHTYQGLGHCLSADMLGDVLLFLNSTMDLDNSNRET